MSIKASILIAAYEKEEELANVFTSISKQKTNFDFEVCFVDDCSYINTQPIYNSYLNIPNKKGIRLKQHIGNRMADTSSISGFKNSYHLAYDLAAPESEIFIVQSADVIWGQDNLLQELVDGSKNMEIPTCRVMNMRIEPDLHLHWEEGIKRWTDFANGEGKNLEYQGRSREVVAWLVPFTRECMNKMNYKINCGEYHITNSPIHFGYKHVYRDDLLAFHQFHRSIPSASVNNIENLVNWTIGIHPERVIF